MRQVTVEHKYSRNKMLQLKIQRIMHSWWFTAQFLSPHRHCKRLLPVVVLLSCCLAQHWASQEVTGTFNIFWMILLGILLVTIKKSTTFLNMHYKPIKTTLQNKIKTHVSKTILYKVERVTHILSSNHSERFYNRSEGIQQHL